MYGIYGNIWGILMVNVTTKIAYIRIRHGICCFEKKKTHGQSSHDKKKNVMNQIESLWKIPNC